MHPITIFHYCILEEFHQTTLSISVYDFVPKIIEILQDLKRKNLEIKRDVIFREFAWSQVWNIYIYAPMGRKHFVFKYQFKEIGKRCLWWKTANSQQCQWVDVISEPLFEYLMNPVSALCWHWCQWWCLWRTTFEIEKQLYMIRFVITKLELTPVISWL